MSNFGIARSFSTHTGPTGVGNMAHMLARKGSGLKSPLLFSPLNNLCVFLSTYISNPAAFDISMAFARLHLLWKIMKQFSTSFKSSTIFRITVLLCQFHKPGPGIETFHITDTILMYSTHFHCMTILNSRCRISMASEMNTAKEFCITYIMQRLHIRRLYILLDTTRTENHKIVQRSAK